MGQNGRSELQVKIMMSFPLANAWKLISSVFQMLIILLFILWAV